MLEKRHRPMIGWNTNTRMLRDFWYQMDKTAGCAACASPGGQKHYVACLNRQEEWKNRTIPQPKRVTREADAEMQQTQAPAPSSSAHEPATGIGDSTVRPIARDIRDTEQLENANDEPETSGDWTRETNPIEIKTSCAVEKAERDAYRSRTHGKRRPAENGNRQHCKQEKK